jgi:hypothetical protein
MSAMYIGAQHAWAGEEWYSQLMVLANAFHDINSTYSFSSNHHLCGKIFANKRGS